MTIKNNNLDRTAEYFKNFDREKLLRSLVKNDSPVILDVGANVGTSLVEFKNIWPDASVHCFEPQEECWTELKSKSELFRDVYLNQVAVGFEKDERKEFYTHDIGSTGISGFNKINVASLDSVYLDHIKGDQATLGEYSKKINEKRFVEVIRMEDYLSVSNIAHINLLKIDTQGHEPEVLQGFGSRLKDVDLVLTELMFYDYYERSLSFSDIERFLLPSGFSLYDISHISKNPMNGRTDWIDVIYINNKFRSKKVK